MGEPICETLVTSQESTASPPLSAPQTPCQTSGRLPAQGRVPLLTLGNSSLSQVSNTLVNCLLCLGPWANVDGMEGSRKALVSA